LKSFSRISSQRFFLWIEFGRIGWKIRERDVCGNDEVAAAVIRRAVENQHKTWKQAVFEVGMIRYTQVPSLGETAPYK
jgi:hypothetical protein